MLVVASSFKNRSNVILTGIYRNEKKENSDFASEYKRYWTQYTAQDLNQKLSDLASNATLSLSEITWNYIADNTRSVSLIN